MSASTAAPAASPVPPALPRFDFPTWLPPMLVKELRQGLRARGFVGAFLGIQGVMVLMLAWSLALRDFKANQAFGSANGTYWALLGVWLLIINPLRALAGLRSEMDGRTLDLLVLTRLNSWRIVLGKWFSLMIQAALLVIALLPYGVVRYFFGSVNLVDDAETLALMYGASGVLTAIALWVSALPRFFRILLPIGFILMAQGLGGAVVFAISGRSTGAVTFTSTGATWLARLDGVLAVMFFLHQAVRRISAPSENHAAWGRLIPLLALLPVPLLGLIGKRALTMGQFAFAAIALLVVGVLEVSSQELPMAVHWRRWRQRGTWGKLLGRLCLPGWPSAALFAASLLVLGLLFALLPGVYLKQPAWTWALIGLYAWQALVFPALIVSFAPPVWARKFGVPAYFIIQAVAAVLSMIALNRAVAPISSDLASALEAICNIVPIGSFWSVFDDGPKRLAYLSPPEWTAHVAIFAAVFVFAFWRSRAYWRWLRTCESADAARSIPAVVTEKA